MRFSCAHEDMGFHAGGGGVGGKGSCSIAGGRDGQLLETKVARHGDSGRQAARFERTGGIEAFVLDVDVGILAAGKHRSETFAERDGIGFGEDGVVTPHGRGPQGEAGRRERALDGGEIVTSVEDAGVLGTDGLWAVSGIVLAAAGAFEMRQHDWRV